MNGRPNCNDIVIPGGVKGLTVSREEDVRFGREGKIREGWCPHVLFDPVPKCECYRAFKKCMFNGVRVMRMYYILPHFVL